MLRFFFFQAEDGIRGGRVTGVQTCALPIWPRSVSLCGAGKSVGAVEERRFSRSARRNKDGAVDLAGNAGRSVGAGAGGVGAVPSTAGSCACGPVASD